MALALLERWVGAQTYADPFRWIVATRDASPCTFHMGQVSVERPAPAGLHPLCANMLSGLDVIEGNLGPRDLVACIEDDDLYLPGYLAEIVALATGVPLAGFCRAKYYNVSTRRYRQNSNTRHASLCQTAFRADVIPLLRLICQRGNPSIDRALWAEWTGPKRMGETAEFVGLKGLPGSTGIGSGHRATFGIADNGMRKFNEWKIPEEYKQFAWHSVSRGG